MFTCGNFSNQEEDYDIDALLSPCTTPKKSRKSSRDSKNPYADRGLDTFSALLEELESKKQKIYTQKGSEEISFVRFVYSSSNDWKPIVVKSKDRKQEHTGGNHANNNNIKDKQNKARNSEAAAHDKHTIETSTAAGNTRQTEEMISGQEPKKKSIKLGVFKLMKNLNHPFYYLPLTTLFILLLLAFYGRSFAILCTSLGWYLVPLIKERSSNSSTSDRTKNKKDFTRKLSEKNAVSWNSGTSEKAKNKKDYTRRPNEKSMASNNNAADRSSSPKSPRPSSSSSKSGVLSGAEEKPTGKHSHRKSW